MRPPNVRALLAVFFAMLMSGALPWAAASAATSAQAGSTGSQESVRFHPTLSAKTSPLTKAQILALSSNANRHVIVVLKNQLAAVNGRSRGALATRASHIELLQRPVLHELSEVHAKNVLAFNIINAIRATVSPAEEAHLRSDRSVKAVVTDQRVRVAPIGKPLDLTKASGRLKSHAAISCPNGGTTYLEPQALEDTHTAFLNTKTPQAQNLATGKGVTVAILSGAIDPFNPDFIRPDGTPVITDYEDFSGVPSGVPDNGNAIESFLDMSSVASQGNEVFNLNDYGYSLANDCSRIRILGMAPGANVMWLNFDFGPSSSAIEGIQYAVANGANVISMSFGSNPNSDTGVDPIVMADQQAEKDGVSIVVSSGDAGPGGSLGTPSSDPGAIAAGASTTEDFRLLLNELSDLPGVKGVLNDNVSSFSSSGTTESGQKSVDIVAPGAFGFMDCDPEPVLYPDCANDVGLPTPFLVEGGTSESAPLTAGEAALVIQAYKKTHKSAPTAAQVKQIITGTATDLHDPTTEQGAGLIDSLAAVQAAMSMGSTSTRKGDQLITSPTTITSEGMPGDSAVLPFTVTNSGIHAVTVAPAARELQAPFWTKAQTVNVTKAGGSIQATVKFAVPKGTDHLSGDISWDTVKQPYSMVEMRLIDPNGKYADNTQPSDIGPPLTSSGFGHIDIHDPTPGTWTAQIHTLAISQSIPIYTGKVHVSLTGSKFAVFGTVSPASKSIAPGKSAVFTLKAKYPGDPGDFSADLTLGGKNGKSTVSSGAIPVILRTLIPTRGKGGTFTGTFTGGNGRPGAIYNQTLEFKVPKGEKNVDVSVKFTDSNSNFEGVLVDPAGNAVDNQSTVTNIDTNETHVTFGLPTAYTNAVQFFRRDPSAGVWRLVLLVNDNVSGASTSIGFTGTVSFNTVRVSATNLPTAGAPLGSAGKTATITIKNTGNVTKSYFLDPRLSALDDYVEGGTMQVAPPFYALRTFIVPPETRLLAIGAESQRTKSQASQPIDFDSVNFDGAPPYGSGSDPDLEATPGFNVARAEYEASVEFTANEVPFGLYAISPAELGPFSPNGAPATTVNIGALVETQALDTHVSSNTGDPWEALLVGKSQYNPLVLAPGHSGKITVAFKPSAPSGSSVSGTAYVDTFATTKGFPTARNSTAITWSGDEVAAFPYSYTVK